jgi:hypothetical protein
MGFLGKVCQQDAALLHGGPALRYAVRLPSILPTDA